MLDLNQRLLVMSQLRDHSSNPRYIKTLGQSTLDLCLIFKVAFSAFSIWLDYKLNNAVFLFTGATSLYPAVFLCTLAPLFYLEYTQSSLYLPGLS